MLEFNTSIFELLSQFRSLPAIGIVADFPIFFLPIFLWGMWLFYTFKKQDDDIRKKLMYIFYSCVLGIIFSYIIKQFIDIDRPDSYLETTGNLIMSTLPPDSFPSDHATVSTTFLISLFYTGFSRIWWIFLPFIMIMNISRVIVWVHWPLDIIAGMLLGIFSAWLFFNYISKLKLVKKLDIAIIQIMKYIKLY